MNYEYFYGKEPEQYAFYKIPKVLTDKDTFKNMSAESKFLYGILLDRLSLSIKNNWVDERGRNYIYMTIENVMIEMSCAKQKACRLLKGLEDEGIIERIRQGFGRPNLIYVKNIFKPVEEPTANSREIIPEKYENKTYECVNNVLSEVSESNTNNTNINKTNINNTYLSKKHMDEIRSTYERYFRKSLSIDELKEKYPANNELIEEVLKILVDTIEVDTTYIKVDGIDRPRGVIIAQFMKLNIRHIEYIVEYLIEHKESVSNKQYVLTCLYNAPLSSKQKVYE